MLQLLTESGVPFEVCNVLDEVYNPGLRDAIKQYSAWPTLPQLYAHGSFLGGADLVAALAADGTLRDKLVAKPAPP
jgi:monothiol glutaredoxin